MQKDFNSVKPYVYWIKNNNTGIKYFGVRWLNVKFNKTPIQDLGKTYFTSGRLKKDFKKNPENFRIKFISTFDTVQEAIDFEYKRTKKVYKNKRYANIASYPQIIHTPEVRRKISLGNKGKKVPEETRRKISLTTKGRKPPDEAVRKAIESRKGSKTSEETRRKISLSLKGRKISEEHRGKLSNALKGRKGLPRSEETKRKISEAKKGKKRSEETRKKMLAAWKRRKEQQIFRRT